MADRSRRKASKVVEFEPLDEVISEEQLVVRIPSRLLAQIDEEVQRMRQEMPGVRLSRADAVRALILDGLRARAARR